MATDYVLFIHGVNTDKQREQPEYADKLFDLIQKSVGSSLTLKKIVLYWGDVNKEAEDELRNDLQHSKAWNQLWFKDFRANQLLQFVGDAALYLSRQVGSQVVEELKRQALEGLKGYNPNEDRLHLVTHSWGTVILFDILFADRWTYENVPSHQDVMKIREFLFGIEPNPQTGIRLASINTMGSPIALFSLVSVDGSSHDFKPLLNQLLKNLFTIRQSQLPWLNFIHPGDPVAWPLEKLMFDLVDGDARYLAFEDLIVENEDLSDILLKTVSQSVFALLHGGDAHGSYLSSEKVAQRIAQTIKKEAIKDK